jgi:hypothetical protein
MIFSSEQADDQPILLHVVVHHRYLQEIIIEPEV